MKNKTAVITGATSGIGAAYASRFAKEGYDLVITGRRKEKIEAFADTIRKECGVNVEVVLVELSDDKGVNELLKKISTRQIDILVNNAGFGTKSLYQDSEFNIMEQMTKINVLVPMKLIHTVLPGMIKKGAGTIINISSESAFLTIPKNSVYSGGKAFLKTFLKTFSEGLHLDLINTGVKVQVVCPGFTRTDFHGKMGINIPQKRSKGLIHWYTPEEVVAASLKDLNKDKVVCIPGISTKMLIRFLSLLPRKSYYRFAYNFNRKKLVKH